MHLVLDARTIRPGATGVGHYAAGLLRGLNELIARGEAPRDLHVTALRLATEDHAPYWQSLPNIECEDITADYEDHPGGDLWMQIQLPQLLRDIAADVLVSPAFTSLWGPRVVRRLLIVPDSIAWEMRWAMPKRFRLYLRAATRLSAWGADRVLSISPPAARRLEHLGFGGRRGVGVVPCGVDHDLFPPSSEPVSTLPDGRKKERPVLIYTASFEPRKNHAVLFEALRRVRMKPELILLHSATSEEQARVSRLTRGIDVCLVSPSNMRDVAAWTRAADIAVFPSLMEGFGIPALEAMACGVPLVAANTDAMRWLTRNGRCARLVSPRDAQAWAAAIERTLARTNETNHLRENALRRAASFSWRNAAAALLRHAVSV